MSTDPHVAWYGELLALLQSFHHSTLAEPSREDQDRETALFGLISCTPPTTPAGAAAMLRAWVAIIRGDEGSKWTDALDLLAMERVAEFLERLDDSTACRAPSATELRFRDLELRLLRAEEQIKRQDDATNMVKRHLKLAG